MTATRLVETELSRSTGIFTTVQIACQVDAAMYLAALIIKLLALHISTWM